MHNVDKINVHVRRLSDITYLTLIDGQLTCGPFQDSVGVLLFDIC